MLRAFLQACHRHDWMPGLPSQASVYLDELPPRPGPLPRFIPEFVMAQLEDPDNLARLPDPTSRHLLVLIQETGLRARDACTLAFNPIIVDSAGWPCLKYHNTKMATEQLVPLSQRAADGVRPFTYATLRHRLADWQRDIDLHDETGQPVRVTAHQFRHTLDKGAAIESPDERPVLTVALVERLPGAIEPHYLLLVLLAVYTSLRCGKIIGLQRVEACSAWRPRAC